MDCGERLRVSLGPGSANGVSLVCMQSGARYLYWEGALLDSYRARLLSCLRAPTLRDIKAFLIRTLLSLDGAFAGVVADTEEDVAILFHDMNGIMPLFFARRGQGYEVATELKACVRSVGSGELDRDGLFSYLCLGTVLPPHTMWADVEALERGAVLEIDFSVSGEKRTVTYLSPEIYFEECKFKSSQEAITSLEESLLEAVCDQSTGKSEVGVFLSGGVDSGLLAAMLRQRCGKRVSAYTIGPWGERSSDLVTARRTGQQEAVRHREYFASRADLDHLPRLVAVLGQPNSDLSALAFYLLSRLAAQDGIDRVFSGQNADTCLGAMPYVAPLTWLALVQRWISPTIRNGLLRWLGLRNGLLSGRRLGFRYFLSDWQDDLILLKTQRFEDYANMVYRYTWDDSKAALGQRVRETLSSVGSVDDQIILADTLLLESPRCLQAMFLPPLAHGVTTVFPYYHPAWVKAAWRIPQTLRRGEHWLKWDKPLLRELARKYLPTDVARKPPKSLVFPVQQWFPKESIPTFARFVENKSVLLREILLPREHLESALSAIYLWNEVVAANLLLKWLVLEIWYRVIIQGYEWVGETSLQEFLDWPLWGEVPR